MDPETRVGFEGTMPWLVNAMMTLGWSKWEAQGWLQGMKAHKKLKLAINQQAPVGAGSKGVGQRWLVVIGLCPSCAERIGVEVVTEAEGAIPVFQTKRFSPSALALDEPVPGGSEDHHASEDENGDDASAVS
jgi:hypothetical protein